MSFRTTLLSAAAAALLAGIAATPASAIKMDGDNYVDDIQKNPRLMEPYADESPTRYRASNPWAGLEDRRQAWRGGPYWGSGCDQDGCRPVPTYRGDVRVRPYRP